MAAGREEGELELDFPLYVSARTTEQGSVAAVEAKLLAVRADEVEDSTEALAGGLAQATAELLQEERRALGRAEHQHRVDCRDVDAFVEQVNGEHRLDSPVR